MRMVIFEYQAFLALQGKMVSSEPSNLRKK
jgi:hypothetical protein